MKKPIDSKRVRDLIGLLDSLQRLQEQLLTLVQTKIDAMRRADVPAMRDLNEREQAIAERLQEREGFRRQLMDVIGEQIGLPPVTARALPVSQLASRLPDRERGAVLAAAGRLRAAVSKVAQVNRVAGAVSREVMNHLQWIFASVRPMGGKPFGYLSDGAMMAPGKTQIFEAVG